MDKTVAKAFDLLERFAHRAKPYGVTELSLETGLSKSNVHRLLQTLIALGYLRKAGERNGYSPTLKLWELGSAVLAHLDLKEVAQPYLAELARQTKETAHLSILDGRDVVYIDKIESEHPIRAYSRIGGRAPAHCVATGKALLAYQPEWVLQTVFAQLTQETPHTLGTPDLLRPALLQIRQTGYAVNRGEWSEGVGGIAAAIVSDSGTTIGAIGLSGPTERLLQQPEERLACMVIEAANSISKELTNGNN